MTSTVVDSPSSSETLHQDASTLRGTPALSQSSSRSSSATVTSKAHWLPGGRLSELILQVFGTSTVDFVVYLMMKKRLDAISSQIDILSQEKASAKVDAENIRISYRDLVELSSNSYKENIKKMANLLRLAMLRVIIHTQPSWIKPGRYHQTLPEIWHELDAFQFAANGTEIQESVQRLRSILVEKVAGELSMMGPKLGIRDVEKELTGTDIIAILCQDLAYGTGSYEVQNALACIARGPWGVAQLRQLDQEGDVVQDAVVRLLNDFDNAYSRSMAFRIFGPVSSIATTSGLSTEEDKIGSILSGSTGIDRLLGDLAKEALAFMPQRHAYCRGRTIESLCDALFSACCQGFVREVIKQGVCPHLVTMLNALVRRDPIVKWCIEEEQTDDPAIEGTQVSTIRLILKIVDEKEAKDALVAAGLSDELWKFHNHPNRDFSDWSLKIMTGQVLQKLC